MNRINLRRMVLAGLAMFVVWIAVEILVEGVLARLLLGQTMGQMWGQAIDTSRWSGGRDAVNLGLAVLNCTLMIWLYAALRPMFGVGVKTALIAAAFGIAWMFSAFINVVNLGLLPARLALLESVFEAFEFPIAMWVGAAVYEGRDDEA